MYTHHIDIQQNNTQQNGLICNMSVSRTIYEEQVLFGLNQVYYRLLKCTTCYHYTNIIKSGLINLIKIGNIFTTEKGLAYS